MLVWISMAILLLILAIIIIDAIPIFRDWFGRIRIGRFKQKQEWSNAITETGIKWLNHTPTIKLTDQSRLIIIDMLRGNYTRKAIQHWQEAALLLGLSEYLKANSNEMLIKEIEKYLQAHFKPSGNWKVQPKVIDVGILAYGMMKLPFNMEKRYKPAFDEVWRLIQSHIGEDGTVAYRKHMGDYRYVDTIGFICPFLIRYGIQFDNEECIMLAVKQLESYEKYGMLTNYYLPGHAYHIKNGVPAGLVGWGRGLGWYAIGLIDSWMELPESHYAKAILQEMVRKFSITVLRYQQASGCWNWSVNRSESRSDSSTTATLGWFLSQASLIPDLKDSCSEGVRKASEYLMKVTRRDGSVDFSQGDTKDLGVYSMHFSILPFTQGFSIRLANVC
ncbi:glycoside hydrolase family 88 protein [Paenibacillus soyae]|uniref:Glycoside hydrolase family 88 protein n=1 Tax=Paenibacillus soyae TaxID=2969249 RepID=A0A9X2MLW3_9BACL|nr:glycoside hydrolase family 88 protein [Paenibacillus soyae]MCR2802514.1 glycoside hydrolase family 88 protein [Paenibacillus soyae]